MLSVQIATFSLQGFTLDVIENTVIQTLLFVECEFAQGSSAMGCFIVLDVYGSSSANHTILKEEGSDFAMANISVLATGGGVIQLTAYSINANGTIAQNALPLTQFISVPPISVTSQLVVPTPSPSAIASITASECLVDVENTNLSIGPQISGNIYPMGRGQDIKVIVL